MDVAFVTETTGGGVLLKERMFVFSITAVACWFADKSMVIGDDSARNF